MNFLPNYIRLLMSRGLVSANTKVKKVLSEAELSKTLLAGKVQIAMKTRF